MRNARSSLSAGAGLMAAAALILSLQAILPGVDRGAFGGGEYQNYYCTTSPRYWISSLCGCPAEPMNDFCLALIPPAGQTEITWYTGCWSKYQHTCYDGNESCGAIWSCKAYNGVYPTCNGCPTCNGVMTCYPSGKCFWPVGIPADCQKTDKGNCTTTYYKCTST